jgi:hypothetical protein
MLGLVPTELARRVTATLQIGQSFTRDAWNFVGVVGERRGGAQLASGARAE